MFDYNVVGEFVSIQIPDRDIYLKDNFLAHYFKWWDDASDRNKYSLDSLGEYIFTLQEMVNYN